jgi:hypothetical protein
MNGHVRVPHMRQFTDAQHLLPTLTFRQSKERHRAVEFAVVPAPVYRRLGRAEATLDGAGRITTGL